MAEMKILSEVEEGMAIRLGYGAEALVIQRYAADSRGPGCTWILELHEEPTAVHQNCCAWDRPAGVQIVEVLGPRVLALIPKVTTPRFRITWSKDLNMYQVDIPKYEGGVVVDAVEHDILVGKLKYQLTATLQALLEAAQSAINTKGKTTTDYERCQAAAKEVL